ncbi:MAG: DUF1206 domain-containing protein [Ilumatobacteraceae bacterium]
MSIAATTASGEQAARRWREPLGRAGIAARGVLYLILGILAIQFARGQTSSEEVSQTGAFAKLAEQPFGKFLLVVLVAGLIALALWRFIQAWVGDPVEGDEAKDRLEFLGKGIVYTVLVITAIKVTMDVWDGGGAASESGNQDPQQASSFLFDLPAGRLLVGLLGAVLIAIALYQTYKYAVKAEFMERISPPPGRATDGIKAAGRAGYGARGVVFTISGIFFIVAAIQYDPNESRGISGALQTLADQSWGTIVLWVTAIGLVLFGLYCFAESRYRRS